MKRFLLAVVMLLAGCVAIEPNMSGFTSKQIETSNFSIAVWEKNTIQKGKTLRVYFEGDGSPNPINQIAKELAEKDATPNVIYVARPCQWSNDKICTQKPEIYKESRFHVEIMKEMFELTEYLMLKYRAPDLELIGYDGGAVIALNLATKLPTKRVITVAGITDVNAYTNYHDLPAMAEAENPADELLVLAQVPQIHYVGGQDTVTPRRMAERFVGRMVAPKSAVVKTVPGATHTNWGSIKLDY
ncbi:MAG: hypothetical protein II942_02125 [Alphaproteobacteria bacterium]|nr:hypothetical protein [Alphaproteobacteria bacterium]